MFATDQKTGTARTCQSRAQQEIAIFPGLQKAGMEASFVRAKFLHRTESKDDASRDAYAVLVLVSPRQEAGEAGQHVIHCHRPEAKALADPYVKAAPRRHGKRSL